MFGFTYLSSHSRHLVSHGVFFNSVNAPFYLHKWGAAIHCFELHDVRYPLPSLGWWACKLPDYRALGSRSLEICYDSIHHLSSNYVFAHSTDLLLRNTWGAQGARVYLFFAEIFRASLISLSSPNSHLGHVLSAMRPTLTPQDSDIGPTHMRAFVFMYARYRCVV